MPFRFPLQALLRVRRSYEERERRRLALLTAQVGRLYQRLDILNQEKLRAWTQLSERLRAGMSGGELHFETVSMATRASRQNELRVQIARLEQQRSALERSFLEARKQRKILDNLRKRKLRDYLQIQGRHEQQRLDDLFLLRRTSDWRS